MTAKSHTRVAPALLRNQQYSGTLATLLYNWPALAAVLLIGVAGLVGGVLVDEAWRVLLLLSGSVALVFLVNIMIAAFFVYDWGPKREYDRLAELGDLDNATVVIDITAGKLRGTRGLLSRVKSEHYFVIDIFEPDKMSDPALKRARQLEPPLESSRRIYRRRSKAGSLPIPHNWADAVYCSFSLHELQQQDDRQALFAEFARILKPNGRLLIAEHGRDWRNFLAFGPGAFSFLRPAVWQEHLRQAGFKVTHHETWRGLVQLWVSQKG